MGGLECGSPQGCASMENTVRCGGSHRAPAESWQASLATGEECSDPRKTREGAGRREKEETEQDQACTRDSRWGRGDRSPVRKTVQDRGLASEAPGERSSASVTGCME